MTRTLKLLTLTALWLLVLDGAVAVTLTQLDRIGRLESLQRYFGYGRSVPGKIALWAEEGEGPGNLLNVAWMDASLAGSQTAFAEEDVHDGPVVRSYGMSFVNNILRPAMAANPDIKLDAHSGPGAPPNYTYTFFKEDAGNRRAGDFVVLGILSSSISAMSSFSNRTWVFEQPAPYTYPVYYPNGDGLSRIDPIVRSLDDELNMLNDNDARQAWIDQMRDQDPYYSYVFFGATWADASPFLRLIRRTVAKSYIQRTDAKVIEDGTYPYEEVLKRMAADFAQSARDEGLIPILFLIQGRDPRDPDLLTLLKPILDENNLLYLASAEHVSPRDPGNFIPDGHYTKAADALMAERFIDIVRAAQ